MSTVPAQATPPVPLLGAEPGELVRHLEICRLQAELAQVEREVRASQLERGGTVPPAQESSVADALADQVIRTMYSTARTELAAERAQVAAAADAHVHDARRRAAADLSIARDELATVLAHRATVLERRVGVAPGPVAEAAPAPRSPSSEPDRPAPADALEALFALVPLASPVALDPPLVAAPAPAPAPVDRPALWLDAALDVESARTDAAFEAWMAIDEVSPDRPPGAATAPRRSLVPAAGGVRALAVARPVEVVAALLAVAVVVAVLLVVVG